MWNWLTNLISSIQNTKSNTKGKKSKKSSSLNSSQRKRRPSLDVSFKEDLGRNVDNNSEDTDWSNLLLDSRPIKSDTPNRGGLGSTEDIYEQISIIEKQTEETHKLTQEAREQNFRLGEQNFRLASELIRTNPEDKVALKYFQNLTYDKAINLYQDGNYDLLQPYSRGYYSATSESMRLNREFWGNTLELIESYNGLFWIVQTIEPYFLLLPNPLKRIAEKRLPEFEYFFETNFISEYYSACQLVFPAYMGYENNQWVMTQKGRVNFVY